MKKLLLVLMVMVVFMVSQSVEARVYTKCPVGYHVDPITFQCVVDVPPPPPPPPAGGVLCANPDGSVTYKTACSANQTPIVIPQPSTNIPAEFDVIVWCPDSYTPNYSCIGPVLRPTDGIFDIMLNESGNPYLNIIYDNANANRIVLQYYYKLRCARAGYEQYFPPGTPVCVTYP